MLKLEAWRGMRCRRFPRRPLPDVALDHLPAGVARGWNSHRNELSNHWFIQPRRSSQQVARCWAAASGEAPVRRQLRPGRQRCEVAARGPRPGARPRSRRRSRRGSDCPARRGNRAIAPSRSTTRTRAPIGRPSAELVVGPACSRKRQRQLLVEKGCILGRDHQIGGSAARRRPASTTFVLAVRFVEVETQVIDPFAGRAASWKPHSRTLQADGIEGNRN